ncbi:hypothetical protein BN1708_006242 [Verticillium longisporum]|uniref:Uncharacterized protein n=1 Tax=Verticillium longisporum TaxID=100787 RepID=A0A0G4MIK6_VERLO|nr:hypothetical protein BN1708_006242 [Verticillium longisporum]
MRGLEIYRF